MPSHKVVNSCVLANLCVQINTTCTGLFSSLINRTICLVMNRVLSGQIKVPTLKGAELANYNVFNMEAINVWDIARICECWGLKYKTIETLLCLIRHLFTAVLYSKNSQELRCLVFLLYWKFYWHYLYYILIAFS